jgi:hypothetical protein
MSHDVRIEELIEANPTLEQQMRDWQSARHRRGENPFDWEAFRTVVSFVGACDPGAEPPSEFFWFTPPAISVSVAPESGGSSLSSAPSARLVSPGKHGESDLTEMKYWR